MQSVQYYNHLLNDVFYPSPVFQPYKNDLDCIDQIEPLHKADLVDKNEYELCYSFIMHHSEAAYCIDSFVIFTMIAAYERN